MASPSNHGDGATFDMHKLFSNSSNSTTPPLPNPNPQFSNPNMAIPQTSSYPPPVASPYQYPPYANVHHQLQQQHPQRSLSYPTPPLSPQFAPHNPNQNPSSNTNANAHGARLMAMLSTSQPEIPHLPSSSQMTHIQPSSSSGSDLIVPQHQHQQQGVVVSPGLNPQMMRMPSSKVPKGRHLMGDRVVYDINVRFPGEVQPQLEVTPITKYGSDPGLVLGRQIAVNKTYICYGLKLGAIRVLNINTALRSLLKGLSQRVTDMAFFAEDVHLLASASMDGRVYVWKITEGNDEENKPQITGKIVIAIQITGVGESVHPRVCWHCHKQEVLVVGIGRYILKIDTNKVGKGQKFVPEEPLKCPIDMLIDGVQLVGSHDGEVTDLSMCQWMTTRLASVSVDGMIKIWEDRKPLPSAVFRPHDGQPVNSVTFLAAPDRPDHIILITGGPLNREMKIWVSSSEEGWLLPSDTESWHCTQTLELKSSEARMEEAFFNQVIALSQAGLLLLANAKRNAIYAVHLEYGPNPLATRMDYIAEFTVAMPILSFTGTCESLSHGEQIVQVYCVQTQAIQQYALDLSQCLPPPVENVLIDNTDSSFSRNASAEGLANIESSGSKKADIYVSGSAPQASVNSNGLDVASTVRYPVSSDSVALSRAHEFSSSNIEIKAIPLSRVANENDVSSVTLPSHPLNPSLSRTASGCKSSLSSSEHISSVSENNAEPKIVDYTVDRQMDAIRTSLSDVVSKSEVLRSGDRLSQDDPMATNHQTDFKHPTHLVTPSEILMASSSTEMNRPSEPKNDELNDQEVGISNDTSHAEVELKVVGESRLRHDSDDGAQRELHKYMTENNERSFYSQASDLGIQMARECHAVSPEAYAVEEVVPFAGVGETEIVAQSPKVVEESSDAAKDVSGKVSPSTLMPGEEQTASNAKGKKQKGKGGQGSRSSSPTPPGAADSFEPGASTSTPPIGSVLPQIYSMQDMLNQLMDMQKEMQKQMAMTVVGPITKEVKRIEASLGRIMEKAAKANADALWAHLQEENAKQDRAARERTQQLTNVISNCLNKDFPTIIEKTMKKELTAIGQSVARTISPTIEKTISTTVAECFQKGVGDKAVNQLEKSVNSKLEATIARQIQAQFQTSGKQALQESLKSSLEASVVPAFEMSCRAMFEQVDATFQKGLAEHTSAAQQQFDASHTPLALTLRDAINSASSMTQTLSSEILDGQRKLLDLAVTGANSTTANPLPGQLSNGPLSGLHEKLEVPHNPTKELSILLAERKYEEAFTMALQRSDVSIVSWLCSQVDLPGLLSMNPLPLSQGVLLSLLQQLACDISNGTPQKLTLMLKILSVINPSDRMIAVHVRPILEQVYQILHHHRNLPTDSGRELSDIRLIMHVINSMLLTSK